MTAALTVERKSGVHQVTLGRAGISGALLAELAAVLDHAEADPDCRVVRLQGADGVFCSGLDFDAATGHLGEGGGLADAGGDAFLTLLRRFTLSSRVIVSTVDGWTSGGGVGLVAASDFVFATPRSQFSLPEALWGLLPCCVLPFLIRRVGFQKAYTMTLSTQSVTAEAAERFHLVDQMTERLDTAVRALLGRLRRLDTSTVADVKRYCRAQWSTSDASEDRALREFARLMADESVARRISEFTTHQKFPWEA
ncbi:enoyl-CoA hydratase-related protein [Actinokineospora iranica]|uniref:Polyketide biosynthesis enoyl-CoA hydratase PksH n=1 Tax=Actinokineospora iranica TaxID=1271860 RepID=A0A1G6W7M7_9PSEU|nr:enoyl-CoA hydratase-related protein [Actinokineospora iranica]SDD61713.1 polyketide biosynthesis enoyl-CoA hydratase PksH [Actinokineospora iranica]